MSSEMTRDARVRKLLDPASPVRDYYVDLANNLLALENSARSVVVSALEPGDGRSSVCLGLGAALAGMGYRAAIIDCNLRRPQLHRVLGEPNFVGLTSALETGKPLEGYGREILPGFLAIPTGPVLADHDSSLESKKFIELVRELESSRDMVILDAPVVEEVMGIRTLLKGLDGFLLVLHGSRTDRKGARKATRELREAGARVLGVVLNGYS